MSRIYKTMLFLALTLVPLGVGAMFTDWRDEFREVYQQEGIDEAVIRVLRRGVTPDNIMVYGLKFDDLNPTDLVKAMYCSGIMGEDIRYAGERQDLAESIIVGGYKKSVEECREKIGYSLLFVPVPSGGVSVSPDSFVEN